MADSAAGSPLSRQDLVGKVAIITGASKGIGRATAIKLAQRGCSILGTCSGRDTLPLLDSLAAEIKSVYDAQSTLPAPKVYGIAANILSTDTPDAIADAVEQLYFGHVDIYVNNAAAVDRTPIGGLEPASISDVCMGNIQIPCLIIDELVKRKLFRKNSRIIFISSAESTRCDPSALMYGATKAASEAMARAYANAFGGKMPAFEFMSGTTANSVLVGLTQTAWTYEVPKEVLDGFKEYWHPRQSIPRMAQPEDVANVVALLCGEEAAWITGSKICADGGAVKII